MQDLRSFFVGWPNSYKVYCMSLFFFLDSCVLAWNQTLFFFISNFIFFYFSQLETVLRIRNVYPVSGFFPSRIPSQKDSRIRIRIKEFKYFNPKIVSKLSEIWSKIFIPDPNLDFLPIPDRGVKKAPDPGSTTLAGKWIRIFTKPLSIYSTV